MISDIRERFLDTFCEAGFRRSRPLSLVQPSITTSFLFSVGFVDVMQAIAGKSVELDGAATVQRCFRHFDLDRVGDGRHLSFFEMAGVLRCREWRITQLVQPLIRFLVESGLRIDLMHVTYFGGGEVADTEIPPDITAREAYHDAGIPMDRIWAGDAATNIWFEGANSGTERSGICGPNSEVFLDLSGGGDDCGPLQEPDRFIELSNIVSIHYQKKKYPERGLMELPAPLVELAVGMERLETVVSGQTDVYQSPKLRTLTEAVMRACGHPLMMNQSVAIVADHIRAVTHLIADGGRPGPKGRGHVIRRLFRRLIGQSNMLNLDLRMNFPKIANLVVELDGSIHSEISNLLDVVIDVFDQEARRMLRSGLPI